MTTAITTTTTTTTTTTNPTTLGTSNVRGASRQTRNNPARTSRNARPTFRQNSLLSNPASTQGAALQEPHGFYPAISHFTDAIAAVPRDFRRHSSLLKEVDAKAWALEDNVHQLLEHCLRERNTRNIASTAHTIPGSTSSVAGDVPAGSAANSVVGQPLDNPSHLSIPGPDMDQTQRHDLYKTLRANLLQLLMPLDEKNHVINNANDDLDKHLRRSDEIWPHIAYEISEDARLGSLKHWALLDLNPVTKAAPVATRGRNGSGALALLDNDIAERSERRREALLAKKQKTAAQLDSDMDDRNTSRKKTKKLLETNSDLLTVPTISVVKGKGKKMAAAADRQTTKALTGGTAMSRDPSLQDNTRKRKALTSAPGAARKRLNLDSKESPKMASSPLAGSFAKDSYKRSPALSSVRPAGRGRQGSYQTESASNRPSSSASKRATNGVPATNAEIAQVAAATGKTLAEVKNTMKETTNSRGQRLLEEDIPDSVENRLKGGLLLERSNSKSSQLKRDANYSDDNFGRRTASPRLTPSALADTKSERTGRAKASKTSTPQISTFAEADASESAANETSAAENGTEPALKLKRPVRPRMKDHHGLHDSLSPKGLPTKRTHKKNGSYSLSAQSAASMRTRDDDIPPAPKLPTSRNNSRSTKNNSQSDSVNGRNVSTPRLGAVSPLVDEPEPLSAVPNLGEPASDRRTSTAKGKKDADKSAMDTAVRSDLDAGNDADSETDDPDIHPGPARVRSSRKDSSKLLGPLITPAEPSLSQGDDDIDEDDEDDPNEQRYCYCNRVSYGEMVACDNPKCAREWFHLDCVGLKALPHARTTWYCEECKAKFVKA